MVVVKRCAIGLGALLVTACGATGAETATLRETARVGATTRVTIDLKAQGRYIPAEAPGASQAKAKGEGPKSLALKVESRLDFAERVVAADDGGRARRTVRRVYRAASAINGEIRPMASTVRPEVALLVAEPREGGAGVVVFSPLGPLKRSELEIVQGPGDPLALGGLLPEGAVAVKARWKVSDEAVRSLTAYDTLTENGLEATLDVLDGDSAKVRLRGEVKGSVLGGEGTMACDGSYTFDRKAGLIGGLTLDRAESRRPGPVEGGLDIKSTLTVARRPAETPKELTDATLGRLALDPGPEKEALLFEAPGGAYSLRHDRAWHVYWDDPRLTVLKRVEGGETVAQCNLAVGPHAGKGRHQDTAQFRDDIRKGLGSRFVRFLGEGEVEGGPAGGYRYKVGVQGRQGNLGVVWYYYLIAGPEGDQLLATFTLADTRAEAFGARDEALVGALRWNAPSAGKAAGSAMR